MHAGWNALLKIKLDPFLAMNLIQGTGMLCGAIVLVFTGLPGIAALPWLIASTILHVGYYFGLSAAYRRADMSQIYPIARGSAPLLTGLFAVWVLGEPVSLLGGLGIAILGLGILTMSLNDPRDVVRLDARALLYAGLTALTICGYTLTDGIGARAAGNAHAYTAALFVLDGLALLLITLWVHGFAGLKPVFGFLLPGLAGGAMSFAAYAIAIWAMTIAPIPLVAATRETSVLFGVLIAVIFLKEPLRANRILAALLIVAGLALIRLQ